MSSPDDSSHTNCCAEIFPVTNNLQWIPYPFHLAPNSIQKCLSLWSGNIRSHNNQIAYFSGGVTKELESENVQETLPFTAAARRSE